MRTADGKIDDGAEGGCERRRVIPRPAVEHVAYTDEQIVAGAAVQVVYDDTDPDKGVVERRADNILDADQRIHPGAGRLRTGRPQVDMHGRCRLRIGGCITAVAADQGVVAIAAIQNVVPGAAIDPVIAAESEQRVVTARAAEVVRHRGSQERVVIVVSGEERGGGDRAVRELQRLDARHVVHHSESSEAEGLRRGIEGDGVVGAASVQNDGVVPRSAVVVVAAAVADQRVVTGAAFEPVVFLVTFQRVIEIGAGKPVNQDIGIARRIAGVVRGMAEAGDDAARRSFVARDVGRIQCVRRSALKPVGEIERAVEMVEVAVPVAVDGSSRH